MRFLKIIIGILCSFACLSNFFQNRWYHDLRARQPVKMRRLIGNRAKYFEEMELDEIVQGIREEASGMDLDEEREFVKALVRAIQQNQYEIEHRSL